MTLISATHAPTLAGRELATQGFAARDIAATPARRGLVVVAIAAAIGLAGSAAWLADRGAAPAAKSAARLAAGPVEKREIVFYPRERAADDSLRNFKPGKAWAYEPPAILEPRFAPVAQARPAAPVRARLAAAPRPPARPITLAAAAPAEPTPRFADLPADRRSASSGFRLSGFVPTGADVARRIGGLGESVRDTVRDSIGTVGSSIGKLMRISSR